MTTATFGCVLVQRGSAGWSVWIVDSHPAGERATPPLSGWLPLGLAPSAPATEALERARTLFPGRLVALYTP